MAYGNVYIFNLYPDTASLTDLNGQGPAGSIAAPTKGSSTPYWEPQQAVVARTNLDLEQLSSPLFVNAGAAGESNTLSINYGGQAWRAHVQIPNPPDPQLESDLWLYLAYEQAFLFNSVDGQLIPAPGNPGGAIPLTKS